MIKINDLLGIGKLSDNSIELAKTIYPDLAQPAIRKVGYALETVLDFGNTILLPLKLANENSKVYFQKHMDSYREKLNKVPEENIGTVPPEIGLPIMDELLKVTNDDLADLFTNLLLNASTINNSQYAHPSFIGVIRNLSGDEAKIIKFLSNPSTSFIFIRFDKVDSKGTVPLTREFSNLNDIVELNFKDNEAFYIKNLLNLGIIDNPKHYNINNLSLYEDLEKQYVEHKERYSKAIEEMKIEDPDFNGKIHITKGTNIVTDYGNVFIKSIS